LARHPNAKPEEQTMAAEAAKVAAIEGADSALVQMLFTDAAARWRAAGRRVVGLIEETHGLEGRTCNAGILRDIVSGTRYAIYLEKPPKNTSCHIDANGAATAGDAVIRQIARCDLVVLSKFGKLEASRSGLIAAFEAAIAARKPVLTTVSEKHLDAWHAFAPAAVALPPDTKAIEDWAKVGG
jgi:hypothetical protein